MKQLIEIEPSFFGHAAILYQKAKAVLNVTNADDYGPTLDDLELAVDLYEEFINSTFEGE